MESGDLDVELDSNRVDEFGRLFGAFDSMRGALREQIADAETARERAEQAHQEAEISREDAEAARQDAVALNDRLEATAADFGDVMADCADGNLSSRMPTDVESDAMREIATAYNEMMAEWETTIGGCARSGSPSATRCTTSRPASRRRRQTRSRPSPPRCWKTARRAARQRRRRWPNSTRANQEIAEQTNMLALNANIEAAHADGNSDGFGVVADENKGLVEDTQAATADIEATIAEVKRQTETTAEEMHSAQRKVDAGSETIEDALGAFETIVDDIEETVDGIQEIDRATADQAESTQPVMTRLETVTEVSTETRRRPTVPPRTRATRPARWKTSRRASTASRHRPSSSATCWPPSRPATRRVRHCPQTRTISRHSGTESAVRNRMRSRPAKHKRRCQRQTAAGVAADSRWRASGGRYFCSRRACARTCIHARRSSRRRRANSSGSTSRFTSSRRGRRRLPTPPRSSAVTWHRSPAASSSSPTTSR
jgi:methyl-accepting chemotaxis protein